MLFSSNMACFDSFGIIMQNLKKVPSKFTMCNLNQKGNFGLTKIGLDPTLFYLTNRKISKFKYRYYSVEH